MVSVWQAHLSFVLLGFVLLSAFRFTAPWRPWLLPVLVALSVIPLNELPLAAYVRSYTDDLAISTLVLLAWVGLCRLGVVQPLGRQQRVQLLLDNKTIVILGRHPPLRSCRWTTPGTSIAKS